MLERIQGRFGAQDRVRAHDGKPVRVSGTFLSRKGWQMLELADGDKGLHAVELIEVEQATLRSPPTKSLGPVALRGEIVESKCYLGAMKPGSGRTHPVMFERADRGVQDVLVTVEKLLA